MRFLKFTAIICISALGAITSALADTVDLGTSNLTAIYANNHISVTDNGSLFRLVDKTTIPNTTRFANVSGTFSFDADVVYSGGFYWLTTVNLTDSPTNGPLISEHATYAVGTVKVLNAGTNTITNLPGLHYSSGLNQPVSTLAATGNLRIAGFSPFASSFPVTNSGPSSAIVDLIFAEPVTAAAPVPLPSPIAISSILLCGFGAFHQLRRRLQ